MQVIWSRTAQTRSCRCHTCLHAATALARRTTTAASKRRLKTSDVFTACYSAMFATAALVDMKYKDDRRKQWDLAIAEAKSSINVTQAGGSSSAMEGTTCNAAPGYSNPGSLVQYTEKSSLGVPEQSSVESPTISNWNESILTPLSKRQNITLEAQLKALDSRFRGDCARWELETLEEGSTRVQGGEPDVGAASRHRKELGAREPRHFIHLEHMQQMVLKLVTRFLVSKESTVTDAPRILHDTKELELESKILADQVALLNSGDIWQPRYSLLDDDMVRERNSLNDALITILANESPDTANIGSVVAKICYNLLISPAPPSIDTYNIMLTNFTRLRLHHLGQAVVDSFFEDSKFRPSSLTVAAILDHYAAKEDGASFKLVIQRMRGTAGDMRIWARSLSILADPAVQSKSWAQEWNAIHRDNVLFAKVPRDTTIFNSLILGSLRLLGIKRAVMYLKAALREGCHVTADLFLSVAHVCLLERHQKAAVTLLSAIISHWHQCKESWKWETDAVMQGIYFQLMDLCGIDPLINANPRLPGELRNVGYPVLKFWLRAVQLEVIDEHIKRSANCISGLEILLATSSLGAFNAHQIVLWMLELMDRHPVTEPRREPGALVTAMQLVTDGFSNYCKNMEAQLFDIVYANHSANSQEKTQCDTQAIT